MCYSQCTLAYAAPEVALAADRGDRAAARAAHDVWSLGVMAYEAIAQRPARASMRDLYECASGRAPYPWEAQPAKQPAAWRTSRLRAVLLPCLSRQPEERPTAAQLAESVTRMGHATTLPTGDASSMR